MTRTRKARIYPSEAPELLALPTNIRLGWQGLARMNTSLLLTFVVLSHQALVTMLETNIIRH